MTNADRQRLAAILGMLGSEHAGERAAAGLHAEAFRRKHRLTWKEMLQPVVLNIPARQPEPPAPPPTPRAPEPPAWVPPEPTPHPATSWTVQPVYGFGERLFSITWMAFGFAGVVALFRYLLAHPPY